MTDVILVDRAVVELSDGCELLRMFATLTVRLLHPDEEKRK